MNNKEISGPTTSSLQQQQQNRLQSAKELFQIKVSTIQPTHVVLQAKTTDSVLHVFRVLIENKILSLPLYSIQKQKYVGFLGILDLIHHFLEVLHDNAHLQANNDIKFLEEKFSSVTCEQILLSPSSTRNLFKSIDTSATLQCAINVICQWKISVVSVVDISGTLQHILSESFLAKYLAKHIQLFPSLLNKTINDLQLGYRKVITISNESFVKDAFSLMCHSNASSSSTSSSTTYTTTSVVEVVGVVDEKDELVGQLSVSDLRMAGYDFSLFGRFSLKIKDLLALVGKNLVIVSPDTTINWVAQIFTTTGLPAIFVVDHHNTIGVVTRFDFLQLFENFN